MMAKGVLLGAIAGLAVGACAAAAQQPAAVDTRHDACAQCRMTVSDVRFAGQIVAPGEEPRFFDDLGCLRTFVAAGSVPAGATAYVADHRTKKWVVAARAVYVKNEKVMTPMASHLLAFEDIGSRDADSDGRGTPLTATDVFGPAGPPAAPGALK